MLTAISVKLPLKSTCPKTSIMMIVMMMTFIDRHALLMQLHVSALTYGRFYTHRHGAILTSNCYCDTDTEDCDGAK